MCCVKKSRAQRTLLVTKFSLFTCQGDCKEPRGACRQKHSADVRPGEVSQKQEMALPLLPCQGSGLGQAAPLSRVLGSGFGLWGSPRSACVELGGSAQGAFSDISVWGLFSKMACQRTCEGGKPHAPTCRFLSLVPGAVWLLLRAQHGTSRHPGQASYRSKPRFHGSALGVLGSQA